MRRNPTPEQKNPVEEMMSDMERIIDTQIEVVLKKAEKINEGNNGVICILDIRDINELEDLRKALGRKEIALGKEQAVKILKIYKAGAGKREFELQQEAYRITQENPTANIAKVPKPVLYRDLSIDTPTQERLNGMGSSLNSNRVEIILMDYIPSEDLATFLFREAVKILPEYKDKTETVDQYDFNSLYRILAGKLDFVVANPADNPEAAGQQAFDQNMEKVYKLLQRSGYTQNPEKRKQIKAIETQLRNTIFLFHQNGLALRDAHHRNFLLSQTSDGLQMFIIDYGDAKKFTGPLTASVYQEEKIPGKMFKFKDDLKVLNELASLIESTEPFSEETKNRLVEKYMRLPDFKKMLDKINGKNITLDYAYKAIKSKPVSFPNATECFAALIFSALDAGSVTEEEARDILLKEIAKTVGEKHSVLRQALSSF